MFGDQKATMISRLANWTAKPFAKGSRNGGREINSVPSMRVGQRHFLRIRSGSIPFWAAETHLRQAQSLPICSKAGNLTLIARVESASIRQFRTLNS
jgi:hypothetical protein